MEEDKIQESIDIKLKELLTSNEDYLKVYRLSKNRTETLIMTQMVKDNEKFFMRTRIILAIAIFGSLVFTILGNMLNNSLFSFISLTFSFIVIVSSAISLVKIKNESSLVMTINKATENDSLKETLEIGLENARHNSTK